MADQIDGFKNGTDVLLFVKYGTPAVWIPLACLKSNGWDGSTDQIDITSKCSGNDKDSLAGDRSWTFKAEGNAINDKALPSRASFNTLAEFWSNGTRFEAKMVGVDDPDDVIRGKCYITSLSKNAGRNEAVGFSVSLQGVGKVQFKPEVAA